MATHNVSEDFVELVRLGLEISRVQIQLNSSIACRQGGFVQPIRSALPTAMLGGLMDRSIAFTSEHVAFLNVDQRVKPKRLKQRVLRRKVGKRRRQGASGKALTSTPTTAC